jgi:hypothetical protein
MPKIMIPVPPSGVSVPKSNYGVANFIAGLAYFYVDNYVHSIVASQGSFTNITFPYSSKNPSTSYDDYLKVSVFSGVKPSLSEANSALISGTFNSVYGSRRLLLFSTIRETVNTDTINGNFSITYESTVVKKGLKAGAATWWAAHCGVTEAHYTFVSYIGDVSTLGGAGEMQLTNTNIVVNQDYILTPFSFRFPSQFDIAV